MIEADLQGKLHVPEDIVTSSCLGLMRLLPDTFLTEFLGLATSTTGEFIPLSGFNEISSFIFWPWLPAGGIPDAMAVLRNAEQCRSVPVILEIKHGAGKSGFSEEAIETAEVDATKDISEQLASPDIVGDQLARYWLAAERIFRDCSDPPLLIYLTHHRSYPKEDVEISLKRAGSGCRIFWLNWFQLYAWVARKIESSPDIYLAERRILQKLMEYLKAKGYACFLGRSNLVAGQVLLPAFRHTYNVTVAFCPDSENTDFVSPVSLLPQYSRAYQCSRETGEAIKLLYRQKAEVQ